jgi:hypothetical protein
MSNAKLIKVIDNIKYTCNICTDEIYINKIISLKCNPTKHIFCYDCIFDWYNQLKNHPNISNYMMHRMCPICRNDGGYLPLIGNNYIRGIHSSKVKVTKDKSCCHKLDGDILCTNKGYAKYAGFCNSHKIQSNQNKEEVLLCGVKLKSKDGYCKIKANKAYGGCCYIHKS